MKSMVSVCVLAGGEPDIVPPARIPRVFDAAVPPTSLAV